MFKYPNRAVEKRAPESVVLNSARIKPGGLYHTIRIALQHEPCILQFINAVHMLRQKINNFFLQIHVVLQMNMYFSSLYVPKF